MLTSYIRAAMRQARYEIVEDDGTFYGEIPPIAGVWANGRTLEECREELESVSEGWCFSALPTTLRFPKSTVTASRSATWPECRPLVLLSEGS